MDEYKTKYLTIKKVWWFLKYQFWDKIRHDIPYTIRNIYIFRKTLINARPWDWSGLYQAMSDCLQDMENCQRYSGHGVHHIRYADRIKVCRLLLNRLIEDDYHGKDFDYVQTGKGFLDGEFVPKNSEQPSWKEGMKIRGSNEKHERELLFKLLAKHSKTFWD